MPPRSIAPGADEGTSTAGNDPTSRGAGQRGAVTPPPPPPSGYSGLSAEDAAQAGMASILRLTSKQQEGVTAVEPISNGWLIAVEVIEDARVPSSADILATYEAELASDGALLAYRRTRRYARGRGDGGGSMRS